ncbi:hypothetical protein HHI36_003832 [Cryptolaemus montrouzieri]|uniref:Uncharacterized protein n=1 Tax=Cryptolaemus montrouzieri TaxID=559131 RepID=A0ABD2NPQ2_9CUCU
MLCPEVLNFEEPASIFQSQKVEKDSCLKKLNEFNFVHSVTVILPDTLKVPNTFGLEIASCDYYKISSLNIGELVTDKFLHSFIYSGNFNLLSINTRIDCDNCVAITSTGQLVLNLDKITFQTLGLEGKISHFHNLSRKNTTMPTHRQVTPLQTLALQSVGTMVTSLAPQMIAEIKLLQDPQLIPQILQNKLDCISKLLITHVPFYLIDKMAVEVLQAVKGLIEKTKKNYYPRTSMSRFLIEMNVVVSLTEVVINNSLREIYFSDWPKIMRYVLYKNLYKMSGLEVLNLGSCTGGWRTSEHDKYILHGITNMKNLRSLCLCFDCTDSVLQVLCENCPNIQCLDVTSSRSVTDRSIPSLRKCLQLRELQLHRTSVTNEGLAQLLQGLPRVQDIGRCDEFGNVIKYLKQNLNATGPFALRKIQTRDLSTENLRLFVEMFPNIECVSLFHDEEISDLTVFSSLDHLKELKLLSCAFYGDYLKQLLEVRGTNITTLHLEHVEEIDLNVLMHISRYCPYLKSLVVYNCDFLSTTTHSFNNWNVPQFQNLERLFWMVDGALTHLEYILLNAFSIKNIHLGSSTGINHRSIVKLLKANPMKNLEELRILFSSDMNMETVELILASCVNLKVLSELESWQGISLEELKCFKNHIYRNNFDLDIRPTLSYY